MERGQGSRGAGEQGSGRPLTADRRPPPLLLVARHSSLVTILLLAFALRVWNLNGVPPGMTHDEANHAREAIEVLGGVFRFFFPLNYGSEPLYSYTVAAFMALLGRGVFALRLVNAIFGTAAVAVTYAWATPRLGRGAALLGAALLAVSFWPLAASREALRAGMLPFFMGLAVVAFWRLLAAVEEREKRGKGERGKDHTPFLPFSLSPLLPINRAVILFGLSVAITLYIYLAARVSWLLFPAFLGYLALVDRAAFRRTWRPVVAGLLLAGLLVAPLFLYLRAHPEMQTRLDMLDRPLQAIAGGDFAPVVLNVRDALLAFVWPGFGDQFLAYNIPGRPVFDVVSTVFFVLGLFVCLWRWRRPAYAFLLLWFLFGILPSLVTGPTANTTRNLAALPAAYLIVAVGFVVPLRGLLDRRVTSDERRVTIAERSLLVARHASRVTLLAISLLLWVGFVSTRDYFVRWADSAAVRGAYQHTLVESIRHVQANYPDAEPILFSTVYPGPAHDASIALALAADRPTLGRAARWVDARTALVLPAGRTLAVIPHATPPHPAFIPYLEAIETIDVRPDDLDPRFTLYWVDGPATAAALTANGVLAQPVDFNGAVELMAAHWLDEANRPGETAELLTVWRVLDPARAGPVAPPTFTTDAVTFAHILDGAGGILAQSDRLDAPSWAWQAGDVIAQIHPLAVPASAAPGEYAVAVGVYDRATGARLPVTTGGDTAAAPPLTVAP